MLFLFSADNCYYYYYACDLTESAYEAIAVYDIQSMKRSEYSFVRDSEDIQKLLYNGISRKELEKKVHFCEYPKTILKLYDRVL